MSATGHELPLRAAMLRVDARIGSGGTEPDATLADRLGMRLNTFLQNVTRARKLRRLAAALDPAGLSTTGRAVLARIRREPGG